MTDDAGGEIVVASRGLLSPLSGATTGVIALGVGVEALREHGTFTADSLAVQTFSLSCEWNVPTLYTAALLVSCALLLGLAAASARRAGDGFVFRWRLLAVGFVYIALDEVLGIHEHVGALVDLNHLVYFDWIVPAGALLVVLALVYLPFVRALPARSRNRFVAAGLLYVGGAVGMEIPLGVWASRHGIDNLGYALIDAVEESLEMGALVLFLLSLLDHLGARGACVRFLPPGGTEETAPP